MKFKVGQMVYCRRHKKYGRITSIYNNVYILYPIEVYLDYGGRRTYTEDGRYDITEDISLTIPLKDKINKLLDV